MFKPQETSSLTPLKLVALATGLMPEKKFVGFQDIADGFTEYHSVLLADSTNQQYVLRAPSSSAVQHKFTSEVSIIRELQDKTCTPKLIAADSRIALYEIFHGLNHAPETLNIPQLRNLAREIANIHGLDFGSVEKLGLPSFTNQQQQSILMNVLDEAAMTGKVPAGILEHFEAVLDDAITWGYESVIINGMLTDRDVVFKEEDVLCFIRWSHVQIQDPAYDLAHFTPKLASDNQKIFIDAYFKERKRHNKHFAADEHLLKRAEFYSQFELITQLLTAKSSGDNEVVEKIVADLELMEKKIHLGEELRVVEKETQELIAKNEAETQKKELQDSLLTQRVEVADSPRNITSDVNKTGGNSFSEKVDTSTPLSERPSTILQSSPTLQAISKDNASEIELELKNMLDKTVQKVEVNNTENDESEENDLP